MRWLLEIGLVSVVLVVIVLGLSQHRDAAQAATAESSTRDALDRLYERAAYHGALQQSALQGFRFPPVIEPAWFGLELPTNRSTPDQPWIDIAPPGDMGDHPPDPVVLREGQAGFWYNPNIGLFRARVPLGLGDRDAVERYNRLNDTSVARLPRDSDPRRQPLAFEPGKSVSVTCASLGYRYTLDPLAYNALDVPDRGAAFSAPPTRGAGEVDPSWGSVGD